MIRSPSMPRIACSVARDEDGTAAMRRSGIGARALCALGLLALCVGAHAATRAQFDRPTVPEGDTVTLVIESDARTSDKPDLSPLRGDFDVLGTSTSTQLSFVNGHRSDLTRWLVQLQPRRAGRIDVAPITVGSEQTPALSLEVRAAGAQAPNDAARHVIVESEIGATGKTIYVQQQVPYTVRLYYDDAVEAGDLAAPRADDAMMEKLGEDRRYTATRDGHDYNVIERRYAVAAEKSGTLVIPPATFRGRVAAAPGPGSDDADDMLQRFLRNSPFANDPAFRNRILGGRVNQGQPISARGRDIALDVRPRPAGFTGHWLPAESLTLHDSWADHPPQFKAGEPVKRTITVEVKGLAASQIPALAIATPDDARVYPEATDNQSRTDGSAVYGIRQQTITYIANGEGRLTVPSVALDWWNTQADRASRAVLQQQSFTVLPGVAIAASPAAPAVAANAPSPDAKPAAATPDAPSPSLLERLRGAQGYAAIAGAALMALAIAAWLFWRRRRVAASSTSARPIARTHPAGRNARADLRRACAANDPQAALRALLAMARERWPADPPPSLQSLASRLGDAPPALQDLERAVYGSSGRPWSGDALADTFGNGFSVAPVQRRPVAREAAPVDVEELYK